MDTTLIQEDINVFGSDPVTIKEQPGQTDYSNGVEVRYTAPAKWWNWFWNTLTSWCTHHKSDNRSLITEETNLLAEADIVPSAGDDHQLTKSFSTISESYSEEYDFEKTLDGGVERYVNRPYVDGLVIVLPDTELL